MKVTKQAILYGFAWSSCSWRIRAALHLKQIPYSETSVDIIKQKRNLTEEYRRINPSQKVPALVIDGLTLVESMAILQYLDDIQPGPPLTPDSVLQRTKMREICETIVSGIQPLQNIGLKPHFPTEEAFTTFTRHWTERGLQTLEDLLTKTAGKCCVGNDVTMADLCLVPQVYNAVVRHKIDKTTYRTVNQVYENLLKEQCFEESHPLKVKEKAKLDQKL